MKEKTVSYYRPLLYSAGFGSILGSGIIVGIASTITVWQGFKSKCGSSRFDF